MDEEMGYILSRVVKSRDKYLEEKPHLKPFQREIDELLEKTPVNERSEVLNHLMMGRIQDLQKELANLLKEVNNALR